MKSRKLRPFNTLFTHMLAILCVGVVLHGCCETPNLKCPRTYTPVPEIHTIAYGDSITKRYQGVLSDLLGGDLGQEGVHLRTAEIASYVKGKSGGRCEYYLCKIGTDCLCDWPPLESIMDKYPDADRLIITLGANDLLQNVWAEAGSIVYDLDSPIVTQGLARLADSLDQLLETAKEDFTLDRIYLTSYHYLAFNKNWGNECAAVQTPMSPEKQKAMNAMFRLWCGVIEEAASEHGVIYIDLLGVLGGGQPLGDDGETGPDTDLFEDCFHPASSTGGEILAQHIVQAL